MDTVAQSSRKSEGELANVLTKRRSLVDNAIGAKIESENEVSTPMRTADALNGSDNSDATPSPEFLRSEKPKTDKTVDTPVGARRSLSQRLSGAGFDVQLSPEQQELKRQNEEEAARLQAPEEESENLTRARTESFRQAFEEEPPEEREKREILRTESFRKASEEFEAVDEASRLFFEEEDDPEEEEFAKQRAKSAEEELLRIQAQVAEDDRRALLQKEEAAKLEAQELMTRIFTAKEAQVREALTAKHEKEMREAEEAEKQIQAQEQEAARIRAANEEVARQKAEEAEKQRQAQEQEAARIKAADEEAARQKAEEEEKLRKAQEQEAARKKELEVEAARQKAEDEKQQLQAQQEEAARIRAAEDDARKKAEQKEKSLTSLATTTSGGALGASQASSTVAARPAPSTSTRPSSSLTSGQKVEVRTLEKKLFKEGKKDVRQYTFEVDIRETQKLLVVGRYSDLRSRCSPVFGGFPSNHAFGDYTRNEDNVTKRAEEIRSFFEKKLNAADSAAMQTMLKTLATLSSAQ